MIVNVEQKFVAFYPTFTLIPIVSLLLIFHKGELLPEFTSSPLTLFMIVDHDPYEGLMSNQIY